MKRISTSSSGARKFNIASAGGKFGMGIGLFFFELKSGAQTNFATMPLLAPSSPNPWVSLVQVLGAFALVIGIFLAGVWLFKNWQRLAVQRGRGPKLNILETRSLGGRHALYVVGYEQQRFLIASSPGGVNFLSHLPAAEGEAMAATGNPSTPAFTQALSQALKDK